MCYDISFTVAGRELKDYFPDLVFDEQLELQFEPFEHRQGLHHFPKHPIIYEPRDDDKLHCRLMEWGIIDYRAAQEPNIDIRNGMANIRSERILDDQTSYWYVIRNRRCLIPVTGTFEHRHILGWSKKIPYLIKPKGQRIFFIPGLYSVAELPEKETGEIIKRWTFGLITRRANDIMRKIHNGGRNPFRMSFYLPFGLAKEFVSKDLEIKRYREILNYEMPSDNLDYQTVWTLTSAKPRPDHRSKVSYYHWNDLPPLGTKDPVID